MSVAIYERRKPLKLFVRLESYQIEDVTVSPYLRIDYKTALNNGVGKDFESSIGSKGDYKYGDSYEVTASSTWNSDAVTVLTALYVTNDIRNPYQFKISAPVGLSASSDIISLYLAPSLGLTVTGDRNKTVKDVIGLAWGTYAEIYITPVKNLEWYFEADVNGDYVNNRVAPIKFATSTGITWYLPAL